MIDHSLLRPEPTDAEVTAGLRTALECQVASVCVRPSDIAAARGALDAAFITGQHLVVDGGRSISAHE
ncbi:hypothetical protein [Actinospica robiniae]|uniref:hypothetical protein n=1 Tax=Actinospica robiniae TaxID=304901 RepID=UPI0004184F15|nr:hypothetical protein [Actinospica robiniae]